jgi:hypothetical protein
VPVGLESDFQTLFTQVLRTLLLPTILTHSQRGCATPFFARKHATKAGLFDWHPVFAALAGCMFISPTFLPHKHDVWPTLPTSKRMKRALSERTSPPFSPAVVVHGSARERLLPPNGEPRGTSLDDVPMSIADPFVNLGMKLVKFPSFAELTVRVNGRRRAAGRLEPGRHGCGLLSDSHGLAVPHRR